MILQLKGTVKQNAVEMKNMEAEMKELDQKILSLCAKM